MYGVLAFVLSRRQAARPYLALVRALDETGNVDNVEVSRDARRRLVVVAQKVKAFIGHRNTRLVGRCTTRRDPRRETRRKSVSRQAGKRAKDKHTSMQTCKHTVLKS